MFVLGLCLGLFIGTNLGIIIMALFQVGAAGESPDVAQIQPTPAQQPESPQPSAYVSAPGQ